METRCFYGQRPKNLPALIPDNPLDSEVDDLSDDDDPSKDPDYCVPKAAVKMSQDALFESFDEEEQEDGSSTSQPRKRKTKAKNVLRKMSLSDLYDTPSISSDSTPSLSLQVKKRKGKKRGRKAKKGISTTDTVTTSDPDDSPDNISPTPPKASDKKIWKHEDIEAFQVPESNFEIPDKVKTPYQYFKALFTDEMIAHIAEHTNLYSAQEKGDPIKTSPAEIEDFLSMLLMMGIINLPSIDDYWNKETWLMYKRDCELLTEKPMCLKKFRMSVAQTLKMFKKTPRVGQPPSSSPPQVAPEKRRNTPRSAQPPPDVQFDSVGHWPAHCESRGRCSRCPKGVSRWKCQKCDVFLCLNAAQNCFVAYHSK